MINVEKTFTITTKTTGYYFDEDRKILFGSVLKGAEIEVEDAIEGFIARQKILESKQPTPLILDIRKIEHISSEARQYSSRSTDGLLCLAIVVDSGYSKIFGNYALFLNRPLIPTKLFTSEEKALQWVEKQMGH